MAAAAATDAPRQSHATLTPQSQLDGDKECDAFSQATEKTFPCTQPHCSKAFVSKYKLLRHMATHSPQKTHQCSFCEKMFHRKDHLKNHLQTHDPNKEAFRCEECGKRYHTKLGYRRHAAMHSAASGDLTCKVCLQGCESTAALLEHLRGHSGKPAVGGLRERRHPCAHCDRRFYTRKDVRRHMVVHTGRKDFLCPHCAQRFGRKDHLTRHAKKSHPQEPPLPTPPTVAVVKEEELGPLMCAGPSPHERKPFPSIFPGGLYEPHLQAPPGMGCPMEPLHHAPLPLPHPLSHHQHHQQQQQHPLPSKSQPGSTSYVKMEMESFLMDLQSGLTVEAQPMGLPKEEPEHLQALTEPSLCPPGMDFSHLLGFLPLNLPPYTAPMSTGGLVMGYTSSSASSTTSCHMGEPTLAPSLPAPPQESLPPMALGFGSSLSSTTLPRFHQAFQ